MVLNLLLYIILEPNLIQFPSPAAAVGIETATAAVGGGSTEVSSRQRNNFSFRIRLCGVWGLFNLD